MYQPAETFLGAGTSWWRGIAGGVFVMDRTAL